METLIPRFSLVHSTVDTTNLQHQSDSAKSAMSWLIFLCDCYHWVTLSSTMDTSSPRAFSLCVGVCMYATVWTHYELSWKMVNVHKGWKVTWCSLHIYMKHTNSVSCTRECHSGRSWTTALWRSCLGYLFPLVLRHEDIPRFSARIALQRERTQCSCSKFGQHCTVSDTKYCLNSGDYRWKRTVIQAPLYTWKHSD